MPSVRNVLETGRGQSLAEKRKSLVTIAVTRLFVGGDKRDRTADLLTASQALSQLSYTPEPEQVLV